MDIEARVYLLLLLLSIMSCLGLAALILVWLRRDVEQAARLAKQVQQRSDSCRYWHDRARRAEAALVSNGLTLAPEWCGPTLTATAAPDRPMVMFVSSAGGRG